MSAIYKIEAVSDKVDDKIDALEGKMHADHKEFRDSMNSRLTDLDGQVRNNKSQLDTHANYFKLITFCFTGGIASLAGAWQWLTSTFHK